MEKVCRLAKCLLVLLMLWLYTDLPRHHQIGGASDGANQGGFVAASPGLLPNGGAIGGGATGVGAAEPANPEAAVADGT